MRIISIDKPKGWTSYDVVKYLKHKFQENKIGHLGTLDPIATGVLPVFMGKATRLIPFFNNVDKTYRVVCKLGVSTDTYDAEGTVTNECNVLDLSSDLVIRTMNSFQGKKNQIIPPFSAAKFNGTPYYKLSRKGFKVPKKSRLVIFYKLKIEKIELPFVHFTVKCSKGTYIRSMVNDLGMLLKVGAHITELERLACGKYFNTNNSISLEKLKTVLKIKIPWISPINLLNHVFTINANENMVGSIRFGRRIQLNEQFNSKMIKINKDDNFSDSTHPYQTKVLDCNQNLIAIGYLLWENKICYFQPSKVFI